MRQKHPEATWLALKTDYLNGLGTLVELAAKYGISHKTVQTRARREVWKSLQASSLKTLESRVEQQVQAKQKFSIEELAQARDEYIATTVGSVKNMASDLERITAEPSKTAQDLNLRATAAHNIDKVARPTFGLDQGGNRPAMINIAVMSQIKFGQDIVPVPEQGDPK